MRLQHEPWSLSLACLLGCLVGCTSEGMVLGVKPSCTDGLRDGTETGVDCGGSLCGPCPVGQGCSAPSDCQASLGARCANGVCVLSRTCAEIKAVDPGATDGIYSVDLGASQSTPSPFPVYCDMTTAGGGWTRVAFEPTGTGGEQVQGNLVYLGIEVGTVDAVAHASGPGLIGARFDGTYHELAVTWGQDYARMTVPADVFVNQVDVAIPVGGFATSDPQLAGWVSSAGGANFCRAARATDVRPGDTSWAVKPRDSIGTGCGCNDPIWKDRGAFYGGVLQATVCAEWGGGWAGVQDVDAFKGGWKSVVDLALWIR
jgi:hypothetical protein